MQKAILTNRLYVPTNLVTEEQRSKFTYEIQSIRDPEVIDTVRTYKEFDGYVGFHRGNLGKIFEVFPDFEIDDQRSIVPFEHDLKMIDSFDLSEDQIRVWEEYLDYDYGLIQAPPRWGKTVVMTFIMKALKQRTLVLADERTLIQQFEDTIREFTNVNELEKQYGMRLVGVPKRITDVYPICTLSSYQTYAHPNAREDLRSIRDAFGMVIIDEAHLAAAKEYARVVSNFNSWYRLPTTATPERKDGLHVALYDVVGPVVAVGEVEGLIPDVEIVWTGYKVKDFSNWNTLLSRLSKDKTRNNLIVDNVLADVRDGHYVLVTTDKPDHGKELRRLIESKSNVPVIDVFGDSKDNRDSIKRDINAGKYPIVVGQNRIIQKGWNVWQWSALHNTLPVANRHNYYQRFSRPRTKCPGCPGVREDACLGPTCKKKKPVVKLYTDVGHPAIYGCMNVMNKVHQSLGITVKNASTNVKFKDESRTTKLNLNK